jgi:glycosyltransferase involved in cell wall biosynthesis
MVKAALVSIIMPAYNAEPYLAESVRSVQGQSHTDWELIVVNDGSTDRTAAIVDGLSSSDQRIKLHSTTNQGPGAARSYGIVQAKGELIAFLDADDLWAPTKLTEQLAVMAKGDYDLVFTSGDFIGGGPNDRFVSAHGVYSGPEMFDVLYRHNRIPLMSVLTTKKALAKGGGFQTKGALSRHCEDYDLWLRMAKAGCSFCGLTQPLISYRIHPGGASRSLLVMEEAELQVIKQYDAEMTKADPEARRSRYIELYNRLVIANAAVGQIKQARSYLAKLAELEPSSRVRSKAALLTLTRRRYGGVSRRLFRPSA